MLELERRDLALADAVLARAGAAARERVDDQPLDELVGERQLGRIVGVELQADVEVAVAGMAEDGRLEAEALHLGAGERDRAGQLGDGDARVRGALVPPRRGCGHRVGRVVPGRPELGSAGRIALVDDLGRSLRLGQLAHERQVGLDRGLGARRLDEQARALGVVRAAVGVDRRERRGVEQLEPRHGRAGRDDRGGRSAGRLDRREGDALRDDVLRDPVEADAHLGDHRERPLRPDEQARQVVAGGRLPRPAARPDDRPVGEHGLEREHVGAHLPVADRRRPGRVRRRHAAERRVGAGIDGEEEPVLARRALERRPRHARLHRRAEILGGDLDDPVHPREIEADPAPGRDHVALEARAGSERRHGHAPLARDRQDARDVLRRGRVDDQVRPPRLVEGDVLRVEVALGVAVRDARASSPSASTSASRSSWTATLT